MECGKQSKDMLEGPLGMGQGPEWHAKPSRCEATGLVRQLGGPCVLWMHCSAEQLRMAVVGGWVPSACPVVRQALLWEQVVITGLGT